MIKAIIFDCFGVLTADSWKEFVATLPAAQRQQASDLNRAYGGSHLSKTEFLRAIYDLTGKQPKDIDGMLDHEATKNTELLKLIATFKPTYKIGLLSNVAGNWIRDRFLTPSEQSLFDDFTFSYEVHMTKPDPRIFALAAERLKLPPSACVLVDDVDYYCDIARQQGMQAVLYQNFYQTKSELQKLLA
jgi:FMN phosphatase YigB (HAD superfamily)